RHAEQPELAHGRQYRPPPRHADLPERRRKHVPEQVVDDSVHVHRNAARRDQQVAVALAPVEPRTHTGLRPRAGGKGISLADLALRAALGLALAAVLLLAVIPHTRLYPVETVLPNSMRPYFAAGHPLCGH